jgi:hypothetical protein
MKTKSKRKSPSRVRLVSAGDVRALLAKTINDHRCGRIEDGPARIQGYLLHILAKVISDTDVEARLQKLEENMNVAQ